MPITQHLDPNNLYCNQQQSIHFTDASVKAEFRPAGELLGFVAGDRPPTAANALFVWQVAVAEAARGMNLGVRMIRQILERDACAGVDRVHTTITPDNAAAGGLVKKLAREVGGDYRSEVLFTRESHFAGSHDDEVLVEIGPFKPLCG